MKDSFATDAMFCYLRQRRQRREKDTKWSFVSSVISSTEFSGRWSENCLEAHEVYSFVGVVCVCRGSFQMTFIITSFRWVLSFRCGLNDLFRANYYFFLAYILLNDYSLISFDDLWACFLLLFPTRNALCARILCFLVQRLICLWSNTQEVVCHDFRLVLALILSQRSLTKE